MTTDGESPDRPALSRAADVLTAVRLVASPLMLVPAGAGREGVFLAVYGLLLATDWIDGRLARWSGWTSPFGARLDSIADALVFGMLLLGMSWLRPGLVAALVPWLAAVAATYAISVGSSIARFRRLPALHAWSAKLAWLLLNVGLVSSLLLAAVTPLRVALVFAAVANVEATLITLRLQRHETDVPSLVHVLRRTPEPRDGE